MDNIKDSLILASTREKPLLFLAGNSPLCQHVELALMLENNASFLILYIAGVYLVSKNLYLVDTWLWWLLNLFLSYGDYDQVWSPWEWVRC